MSVIEGAGRSGLVARVINILTKPAVEWDVIAAEPATVNGVFTGYACILAAIPAICSMVGSILYLHSVIAAVIGGVLGYVLSLVGVYVLALIVDMLATNFGGQKNPVEAMKLVAYGYTASWVAGVGGLLPGPIAGLLALAGGIYSLYLIYIGLPKLMKCPPQQTTVYFIVVIVVAAVIYAVVGAVLGIVIGMFAVGALMTGAAAAGAAGAMSTH